MFRWKFWKILKRPFDKTPPGDCFWLFATQSINPLNADPTEWPSTLKRLSATVEELFKWVWPFWGIGSWRVKIRLTNRLFDVDSIWNKKFCIDNLYKAQLFHWLFRNRLMRQKGESQNGCFKENEHVCVSRGNKCWLFGKFDVLCFLNTRFEIRPFALLLRKCSKTLGRAWNFF